MSFEAEDLDLHIEHVSVIQERGLEARLAELEADLSSDSIPSFGSCLLKLAAKVYRERRDLTFLKGVFLRFQKVFLAEGGYTGVGTDYHEIFLVLFKEEVASELNTTYENLTNQLLCSRYEADRRFLAMAIQECREVFPLFPFPTTCREKIERWAILEQEQLRAVASTDPSNRPPEFQIRRDGLWRLKKSLNLYLNIPPLDEATCLGNLSLSNRPSGLACPFVLEILFEENPGIVEHPLAYEKAKSGILRLKNKHDRLSNYSTLQMIHLLLGKFETLGRDEDVQKVVTHILGVCLEAHPNEILPTEKAEHYLELAFQIGRATGMKSAILSRCHPSLRVHGERTVETGVPPMPVSTPAEKILWGNLLGHNGVSPLRGKAELAKSNYDHYVDALQRLFQGRPLEELLAEVLMLFYHPKAFTYSEEDRTLAEAFAPERRRGNCEGRVLGMGTLIGRLAKDHPDFGGLEIQSYVKHVRLVVTIKDEKYLLEGGYPVPWVQENGTALTPFEEAIQLCEKKHLGSSLMDTINEDLCKNSHLIGRVPPATKAYPHSPSNDREDPSVPQVLVGSTFSRSALEWFSKRIAQAALMVLCAAPSLAHAPGSPTDTSFKEDPINEASSWRPSLPAVDALNGLGFLLATTATGLALTRRGGSSKESGMKDQTDVSLEGKSRINREGEDLRASVRKAWESGPELLANSGDFGLATSSPIVSISTLSLQQERPGYSSNGGLQDFFTETRLAFAAALFLSLSAGGLWYLKKDQDTNQTEGAGAREFQVFLVPTAN